MDSMRVPSATGLPLRFRSGLASATESGTLAERVDDEPTQTLRWLEAPGRPGRQLSAARVVLSAGRHPCIWPGTWDGVVLRGDAELGTREGVARISAGHAITWDGSASGTLEVVDTLDLFIVVPTAHPGGSDLPQAFPRASANGVPYTLPSAVAGDPSSVVTWHRTGPEGTGAFFSGRWRSESVTYDKKFIADEFVLIERGSIQIWNAHLPLMHFGVGDIAFFPRDLMCRRQVSDDFQQWFAGR